MNQPLTESELDAIIRRATTLHDALAAHTYPNGGTLRCEKCKFQKTFTQQDAAQFFKTGWPRHHGTTMMAEAAQISENPA